MTSSKLAKPGTDRLLADYLKARLRNMSQEETSPITLNGEIARYIREKGIWERVSKTELFEIMDDYPKGWAKAPKGVHIKQTLRGYESAINFLLVQAAKTQLDDTSAQNGRTLGIGFADGFLNLQNPDSPYLEAHKPTNYLTYTIPIPCPDLNSLALPNDSWLAKAFEMVWKNDKDKQEKADLLGEFVGASLIGKAPVFQTLVLMYGSTGKNGKSTIIQAIEKLFGHALTAVDPSQWEDQYYRASLAGALLNTCTELPDIQVATADSFKKIVTGEVISARQPYGRVFYFNPNAGHLFATNKFPATADQDDGFWRRWVILTFNRVIPKEEYTSKLELQQRITDDLPNLAKWAIAGAQRIIKRNEYIAPPSSKETLNEWKINTDQVAQFVKCATIKPGGRGRKAATHNSLFTNYKEWCMFTGHKQLSGQNFFLRLSRLGITDPKTLCVLPRHQWAMAAHKQFDEGKEALTDEDEGMDADDISNYQERHDRAKEGVD